MVTAAEVSALRQLLLSNPHVADRAHELQDPDLRLLIRKGYNTVVRLAEATEEKLRAPPGEAVQAPPIEILLEEYHPAALQQGRMSEAHLFWQFSLIESQTAAGAGACIWSPLAPSATYSHASAAFIALLQVPCLTPMHSSPGSYTCSTATYLDQL